jgi:hypothetical protein
MYIFGVLFSFMCIIEAIVFLLDSLIYPINLFNMCIFYAIGAISIFPVPRYTLTNPSPETADPSKLLLDFSTLKATLHLLIIT